jgi:hypothetical protein
MSVCETVEHMFSAIFDYAVKLGDALHAFGMESTNYGSLVTTLIAALILFSIKEFFNQASNYSGVFFTKSTVVSTAYNPYKHMQTFHTLILFSDGHEVSGTSEKTGDIDSNRSYEFEGAGKIRGVVSGSIERNYIRSSVLNIHIVEQGQKRESTTYMSIKIRRYNFRKLPFSGRFYTTAANTKGSVLCGRDSFSEHPSGLLQFQSIS